MNILVSSNAKYLPITATMIYSLWLHNRNRHRVWFLYNDIEEADRESFIRYLYDKCNAQVHFVKIDKLLFDSLDVPLVIKHISIETYYRIIAQFVLPSDLDRILWLDSDIIVKRNIDAFYNQSLEGKSLVACRNMGDGDSCNRARLGLPEDYVYFNAGVILFNLEYLRVNTTINGVLSFCKEHIGILKMQDQDLLNLLYHGSAMVIQDQLFNCMVNWPQDFITDDIVERCRILHYAGWQKPWRIRWQNRWSHYYWEVREKEGLQPEEYWVRHIGVILAMLHLNDICKFIMMPWYWVKCRLNR